MISVIADMGQHPEKHLHTLTYETTVIVAIAAHHGSSRSHANVDFKRSESRESPERQTKNRKYKYNANPNANQETVGKPGNPCSLAEE